MKNRSLFISLLFLGFVPGFSQGGFHAFIYDMLYNNKTLLAALQLAEARETEAYTGIYLSNPDLTYDQLLNPAGGYSEILLTQSFDFPTVYKHRREIAGLTARQADDYFRSEMLGLWQEAATVYAGFIRTNRKLAIMIKRAGIMDELQTLGEKKLLAGEGAIFESGRLRIESARMKSEIQLLENDRNGLARQLTLLNGGVAWALPDTIYPPLSLAFSIDSMESEILEKHPQTRFGETQAAIAEGNVALQKSLRLPRFEAGFRQDFNSGQAYYGFHAGISLPLFENRNTVNAAVARQWYAEAENTARLLDLENDLLLLIANYQSARESAAEIANILQGLQTQALLLKAYEAGQIDYMEFFQGWDNYYQTALYLEELRGAEYSALLQLFVLEEIAAND